MHSNKEGGHRSPNDIFKKGNACLQRVNLRERCRSLFRVSALYDYLSKRGEARSLNQVQQDRQWTFRSRERLSEFQCVPSQMT